MESTLTKYYKYLLLAFHQTNDLDALDFSSNLYVQKYLFYEIENYTNLEILIFF